LGIFLENKAKIHPVSPFDELKGPEFVKREGMRQCLEFPIRCAVGLVLSLRSERGVVGSVTHLDALLSQRLALLHTLFFTYSCAWIYWKCFRAF
jgi:hypothetical protein